VPPRILVITTTTTLTIIMIDVVRRCEELIRLARDMGKRQIDSSDTAISRSDRRKVAKVSTQEVNRYSVLVQLLEQDLEKWQMGNPEYYRKHFNPLVPFAKLLFGIVAVVLTLAWLIHILIYMLFSPALDSFLNKYFTWFDQWFPLFGTISVAIFGLYLLLAAAKVRPGGRGRGRLHQWPQQRCFACRTPFVRVPSLLPRCLVLWLRWLCWCWCRATPSSARVSSSSRCTPWRPTRRTSTPSSSTSPSCCYACW